MTKKVPCLYEEQIERDASALLAEFSAARGVVITPPIPIEDTIEKHLKLRVEFDDTHRLLRALRPPVSIPTYSAPVISMNRIVIDESLDPEENPSKEGRYRYTLAHEGGGHWRLHRRLFANGSVRTALFDQLPVPSVICRSSRAKEPIQWQADYYASLSRLLPALFRLRASEPSRRGTAQGLRLSGSRHAPRRRDGLLRRRDQLFAPWLSRPRSRT